MPQVCHIGIGEIPWHLMDYHNTMLNLFEQFEATQAKLEKDNLLKLSMPQSPTYYVEAFLDGNLEWTEWAYDDDELQRLKNDAIDCGFTFTVEEC
jgi:hypothetical protein